MERVRAGRSLITLLLHALMKERVPPGLADNEISPLDNHNADKEAGVAGELDDFPLLVGLPGGSTSQPATCVSLRPQRARGNQMMPAHEEQPPVPGPAEPTDPLYLHRHVLTFQLLHAPKPEEPHKRSPAGSPKVSGGQTERQHEKKREEKAGPV